MLGWDLRKAWVHEAERGQETQLRPSSLGSPLYAAERSENQPLGAIVSQPVRPSRLEP